MTSLELTLLYLLAAVLGVVACRSLKLPPMLGYLAVGVLIGPHALALARNFVGCRADELDVPGMRGAQGRLRNVRNLSMIAIEQGLTRTGMNTGREGRTWKALATTLAATHVAGLPGPRRRRSKPASGME